MPESDGGPGRNSTTALVAAIFSWPTVAILAIALLWTPLRQVGTLLPRIVEHSDTIVIGSLTLNVRKSLEVLAKEASPEVRTALAGMDAEDVELVLTNEIHSSRLYLNGHSPDQIGRWKKLSVLGLVRVLSDNELRLAERAEGEKRGYYQFGVDLTDKYFRTRKFLARAVVEIVNSSLSLEATPSSDHK